MAKKPERALYPSWNMVKFYNDSINWESDPLYGWCNKNKKRNGENYSIYTDGLKVYTTIDSKMQAYAEKAVLAGNDADAAKFLQEKAKLTTKQASLQQTYDVAAANAIKMRQMHDKLVNDISELDARRDAIKAKIKVAKTQERINKLTSSVGDSASSISAFERMEAKANSMLDSANAMADLNQSSAANEIQNLAGKYDAAPDAAVQDEIAAIKAKLGVAAPSAE